MEGLASSYISNSPFHQKITRVFDDDQRNKDYFAEHKSKRDSLAEILHDIKEINSIFSTIDQKTKFSAEEFDGLKKLYYNWLQVIEDNEGFLKRFAKKEVGEIYKHSKLIEKTLAQKNNNTQELLLKTNNMSYRVFKGQLTMLATYNQNLIKQLQSELKAMPIPVAPLVDIASKAKPVKELEKEQEIRLEIKPEPKIKIEEPEIIEKREIIKEREVLKLEKKGFLTKDNIETATNLINSIVQECPDSTKYIVNGELNYIFTECREVHDIVQSLGNEEAADDAWFHPDYVIQLQQMSERLRSPRLRALREAIELALEVLPAEFSQLPKDNRIDYLMQVFARMERNLEVKGMISIQDVYELEILKYELKWIVKNISNKENQLKTAEFIDWFRVSPYTPLFISINTANAGLRECIPVFPIEAMCWQEKGEIFWEEVYRDKLIFYKMISTGRDVKIFEFSYEAIDWVPCENYEERSGLQDEDRKHLNQKQEKPIFSSMSKKDTIINNELGSFRIMSEKSQMREEKLHMREKEIQSREIPRAVELKERKVISKEEPKKQIEYQDLRVRLLRLLDLYPNPRAYPLTKEQLKTVEEQLLNNYRKAEEEITREFHDLPQMRDQGIKQQRELILRAEPYKKDLDIFYSKIKAQESKIMQAIETLERDLMIIAGEPVTKSNKLRELAELFKKMAKYGNCTIVGLSKIFNLIYRIEELLKLISADRENLQQIVKLWLPVKPVNGVVVKTVTEGYKLCTPIIINKQEQLVWFVGENGDTIRYEVFNKFHDLTGIVTAKVKYDEEQDQYSIIPFTDTIEQKFVKFEV